MKTYEFSLIATGLDPEAEDFEDRFFEAGCDDATISFMRGWIVIDFAREAKSFSHALITAMRDVKAAGATIVRIEPDDKVSISEIASRASITRQAVSLYAKGGRGKAFPLPVRKIASDTPLWDWEDVARWLFRSRGDQTMLVEIVSARVVKAVNLGIEGYEPPRSLVHPLYQAGRSSSTDSKVHAAAM